ncbi:MAG: hypothetical protein JXA20_05485 [Spirochaetes bacterium]|nr:hypothetical protein [Spirochaetota bacterium]
MDSYLKKSFDTTCNLIYEVQQFEKKHGSMYEIIQRHNDEPDRERDEAIIKEFRSILFPGNPGTNFELFFYDDIERNFLLTIQADKDFSTGAIINTKRSISAFREFEKTIKKQSDWLASLSNKLSVKNEAVFSMTLFYYQRLGRLAWDDDELLNGGKIEVRGGDEGIWILSLFEVMMKMRIIKNIVANTGSLKDHTDRIEKYFQGLPKSLNALYKKGRASKEVKLFYHTTMDKIEEELTAAHILV